MITRTLIELRYYVNKCFLQSTSYPKDTVCTVSRGVGDVRVSV